MKLTVSLIPDDNLAMQQGLHNSSFLVFAVCLVALAFHADAGEIAVTFDDFPRRSTVLFTGMERTERLLNVLDRMNVEAAFFCVPGKFEIEEGRERAQMLGRAGHLIGNHGYSHLNLDKVGADLFTADLKKAHHVLKDVTGFRPIFRYPFSAEGVMREDFVNVREILDGLGYTLGYFTVESADWYMNTLLQDAVRDGRVIDHERLRKAYLKQNWRAIKFYDAMAKKVLGRSPRHVLLLHINDITAMYLEDLINMIRSKGWKVVPASEAFSDPIADMIPAGLDTQYRVSAIALERGYRGVLWPKFNGKDRLEEFFRKMKVFETP